VAISLEARGEKWVEHKVPTNRAQSSSPEMLAASCLTQQLLATALFLRGGVGLLSVWCGRRHSW